MKKWLVELVLQVASSKMEDDLELLGAGIDPIAEQFET